MVWQRRRGIPWGTGVAAQIRTPQNIVKGAVRQMMDNAGRAGGPQVIIQDEIIEPEDNIYEIKPWKIWRVAAAADKKGIKDSFRFEKVDMYQVELNNIVLLGMKLAEEVSGMPMIMQGQEGTSVAQKTARESMIQNNNGSTVMRRLARLFDDLVTEPHLRRYYNYILQYGEDDEKGDLTIDARGSTALVERTQHQTLLGKQDMFNPHPPDFKVERSLLGAKLPHQLSLFRRRDVFIGHEVVGHHYHLVGRKDPLYTNSPKLPYGNRGGNIVG